MKKYMFLILALNPNAIVLAESRLSLKEFMKAAESNDAKFKSILGGNQQLSYIVDLGLPSRETVLSLKNEHGIDTKGDEDTSTLSGTISKKFIESGTAVSLSHSATSTPERKEDVTEFRIEQDLYKNLLGRDVRLKKEALRQEEDVIRLEVKEKYEDYLEQTINLYLEYKKSFLDLDLAKRALVDATQLRNEIKDRLRSRIALQSDLDRSELQVLLSEEEVQKKREIYQLSWLKIKEVTQLPKMVAPVNLNKWRLPDQFSKPQDVRSLRVVKMMELKNSISSKEFTISKRDDSPSLSLIAGYQKDKSQRFSSTVNREEAVIGLQLTVPIGDSTSSAAALKAAFTQSETAIEQVLKIREAESLTMELQSALQEVGERIKVGERKIKLAETILKDDEKRYEFGRIDLDRLITSKQKLVEYQFQNQTHILSYNQTMLRWLSLSDRLLETKDLLN